MCISIVLILVVVLKITPEIQKLRKEIEQAVRRRNF